MKKHAPAALRNRDAILVVLAEELPKAGTVLEVASGSGEHAMYFAKHLPSLTWQPSDADAEALASIAAYRNEYKGENVAEPMMLDASQPDSWPVASADAVLCVNMVHISPWAATIGLFAGASKILDKHAPLILYGPYLEEDIETAESNLAFDAGLKERNPEWGLRELSTMDKLAADNGFTRTARHAMPANNLMLVYRRT